MKNLRRKPVQPEMKFGKPKMAVYVGFMGQQDGLDLWMQSIDYIVNHEKRQDTHFVMVGGGTMLPELRQIAASKNLESYVTFTGQVTHDEVIQYLSNADLGVATDPKNSMNDKSTMIKILEYMAFELPIVLFDLKEGRRSAGPAALYATPNDPIEFAQKVIQLLDSPALCRTLGAIGRERIDTRLNWEVEKTGLLQAYSAALQTDEIAARHDEIFIGQAEQHSAPSAEPAELTGSVQR
jgi:glycosyltransferase involved in cell wall biosynthesis